MQVLVVNAGSSSLKLRVLDAADEVVAARDVPPPGGDALKDELGSFLEEVPGIDATGHRVVHGGSAFRGPTLLKAADEAALRALAELAPLHNPPALAAIHALRSLRPELPQVACFDTTFHATMPASAATYALPSGWRRQWDLRRYGFHGLSHAFASRRAAQLMGRRLEDLRLVTAHLGSGASLAAVAFGRSIDTTMGFTPLEGLVMATRSGSVDPGLILWLQRVAGLSAAQLERGLESESGLLGLSDRSGDLRLVISGADAGDHDCQLAYEVYLHRLRREVAAMVASLGGLDGLVFTGGAGEASARLRQDACAGLGFLGVSLDEARNRHLQGDGEISPERAAPAVLAVEAREDLEIARQVRGLLGRR